jgi:RNA polymerase sigma-70 factor, ECF subfamily
VLDTHDSSPLEADRGREADRILVDRLRDGDQAAFVFLVRRYTGAMLRVASAYLPLAAAEEVVQDTWLGVLEGIDRFEGRSSLKNWVFTILTNRSKTRAQRERRSVPFSALADPSEETTEPSVDPSRFLGDEDPKWPHHWATPPKSWGESPEERVLAQEGQARIREAIDTLPPGQRQVITLCDVAGCEPDEVCSLLGITRANQRVLLHRARSKVRRALEQYFEEA